MANITAYIILIIAVILGTAANGFAKGAQGFTLLIPSILTAITIVGCMYALSLVCLLYTSPSPRDLSTSRMPSSA